MMLTITHTHEAGTIIEGTSRGDGTAPILKTHRWRWGRSISAWYIPGSRDHHPDRSRITATADALHDAGYTVTCQIDDTARSTAQVEADKIARQQARADALAAKAGRKAVEADRAWERHLQDVARLPEGGEPVKVGHHSEGRHRAALARADRSIRRSIEATAEADRAAQRAETASHTTGERYNPVTVSRRIEKIGADIRRLDRKIASDVYDRESGYRLATNVEIQARRARLTPRREELADQLAYWQQVHDEQVAAGTIGVYDATTIRVGDDVKVRGSWWTVTKVNPKTVLVSHGTAGGRARYSDVQAHRPAGRH